VLSVYRIDVPSAWGKGAARKKALWKASEEHRLCGLVLPIRGRSSAVAASLWRAARILRERDGFDRRLLIVSDLREVDAALKANFERKVLAPREFVKRLQQSCLLADLTQVEVRVCGVHDLATRDVPSWTAAQSVRLRDTWRAAFAAMGVPDVKLLERCDPTAFGQKRGVGSGAAPPGGA
jgi:hypothetical protein